MHVERKSFEATEPVALDVMNHGGSIAITAAETDTVEVEVRAGTNKQRDEDACRDTEISFDAGRSVLVVHAPKLHFGRGAELVMTITVPTRSRVRAIAGSADIGGTGVLADVEAVSGSGNITFDAITDDATSKNGSGNVRFGDVGGDVDVKNGSGNIEIGTVAGDTDVHSASGNVRIASAGALKAGTASGNLRIGAVTGSASVTSASGDIEVASIAGDTRAKAASGNIRIGIASGILARLDVSTVSGQVDSSMPVDESEPADGGKQVTISARTVSGDVSIVRAAKDPSAV